MFDHGVWELSIMFRRADFPLFSGGDLVGGLSVFPDVLPGEREPRDWDQRFETINVGPEHRHAILPRQLRSVLPALSQITWGQGAQPPS